MKMQVTLNGVEVQTSLCSVQRRTDASDGSRVNFDPTLWFSLNEASEHAREQSQILPEPNRMLVYDFDNLLREIWQCGEQVPLFQII